MKPWVYRGRWALVTGASAGIGTAFAHALAERGMNLVLAARREDRLSAIGEELTTRWGIQVRVVSVDLSVPGESERLWREAGQETPVDLVINNAGFGAQGAFDQLPLLRQVEMVQLNCTALLELTHLALAEMRERDSGGIINVASIAAFQPVPNLATYAATKAFVHSLTEAIWAETRGSGVRVLSLCPGRTPTEFQAVAGTGNVDGAFGMRTAEQVVAESLRAFEEGKSYEVPGVENLMATWLVRVLPRSTVTRVLKSAVRRASKKGPQA